MPVLCRWSLVVFLWIGVVPSLAQPLPYYQENPCPFEVTAEGESEGETILCGTLFVPEHRLRADVDVPTLELAVVIIRSTAANPAPDPLIYLEGGPGGSAVAYYDVWLASAFREQRDIILLDQRGTGFSKPSLNCPEYDDFAIENPIEACRDRLLDAGIDLRAYNSRENAADVADLIRALDLEQANLLGVSYGTRLALTVLRDHPQLVRSVILDAVYPPQVDRLDEQPKNAHRAFEVLFEACAVVATCHAAYPDLRATFYAAIEKLNAEPLLLPDETFGGEYPLDGLGLVDAIFADLYDTDLIPFLPAKIVAAERGDATGYLHYGVPLPEATINTGKDLSTMTDEEYFATWAAYLGFATPEDLHDYLALLSDAEYYMQQTAFILIYSDGDIYLDGIVDDSAEGMYASVECTEDIPFNAIGQARIQSRDIPEVLQQPLLDSIQYAFDECYAWDIPEAASLENDPVFSTVPTLIFSGEYDPITPPAWGAAAADYLPNGYHYVLPGVGHGSVDRFLCPTTMALAFLENPTQAPNSECVLNMFEPVFYVPNR